MSYSTPFLNGCNDENEFKNKPDFLNPLRFPPPHDVCCLMCSLTSGSQVYLPWWLGIVVLFDWLHVSIYNYKETLITLTGSESKNLQGLVQGGGTQCLFWSDPTLLIYSINWKREKKFKTVDNNELQKRYFLHVHAFLHVHNCIPTCTCTCTCILMDKQILGT